MKRYEQMSKEEILDALSDELYCTESKRVDCSGSCQEDCFERWLDEEVSEEESLDKEKVRVEELSVFEETHYGPIN